MPLRQNTAPVSPSAGHEGGLTQEQLDEKWEDIEQMLPALVVKRMNAQVVQQISNADRDKQIAASRQAKAEQERVFFCAGDFQSSRLDIQHPSCQIALVHNESGKMLKRKAARTSATEQQNQKQHPKSHKTHQGPNPTDNRG